MHELSNSASDVNVCDDTFVFTIFRLFCLKILRYIYIIFRFTFKRIYTFHKDRWFLDEIFKGRNFMNVKNRRGERTKVEQRWKTWNSLIADPFFKDGIFCSVYISRIFIYVSRGITSCTNNEHFNTKNIRFEKNISQLIYFAF